MLSALFPYPQFKYRVKPISKTGQEEQTNGQTETNFYNVESFREEKAGKSQTKECLKEQ